MCPRSMHLILCGSTDTKGIWGNDYVMRAPRQPLTPSYKVSISRSFVEMIKNLLKINKASLSSELKSLC